MDIEKEITSLKERNRRVEIDKAWETSLFRVVTIAVLIYVTICIIFFFINISNPLLNAIIPPIGYILSTLSLPIVKNWWLGRNN
jgi:hypothetical protein